MTLEAPFARYTDIVRPEWIDYSGHMNMGYYLLAFEQAAICFFSVVDISEAYRMRTGHALFVAEAHIKYERELLAGAAMRFESQILDASDKAIDCMHFMYAAEDGYLAAVNQVLYLHINLEARRSVPFPDDAQDRIESWRAAHAILPRPAQAGRSISLRKG
jgi:acyl-CoA thioester hydrolase